MKKKYAIDQLQEAIEKSNNIIKNKTGVFQKPIIPGDALYLTKERQTMLGKDWNYT